MKRKLLVVDCETGGLDPAMNAITSLAAVVYHNGHVDEAMEWIIDDPAGLNGRDAQLLNGITPERAHADGRSPWYVVTALQQLLLRNDMHGKVTLVGHNLAFDVGFLQRLYRLAGVDYEAQFNYGGLCTKSAALLLEQSGRLHITSSSLADVAPALGVIPEGSPHGALNDAMTTARVLTKMIERLQ